jgi:hypothetical protein
MVQSFIPAVNLEDNRGCQISTVVLNNLFNAVQYVIMNNILNEKKNENLFRKKHTDQLKNLMIDIITVILAEYETIPFSLLEVLFSRIIDPEKVLNESRIYV